MRPQPKHVQGDQVSPRIKNTQKKVLFVSEQLAAPEEVLPYLTALMNDPEIMVYIVFRPYWDGFEVWLKKHHPEILERLGPDRVLRNGIREGIPLCDIAVGSHSTAVLEMLLELKPMVLFNTKKWGDYFEQKASQHGHLFFAENPTEFVYRIKNVHNVSISTLEEIREQFFGDLHKNGSEWVVVQVKRMLTGLQDV